MLSARALCLGCCLTLGSAWAGPAHIDSAVPGARAGGQGVFTYFGLRIYEARLWVGEQGYRPDAPFALELHYARNLQGAKIADASADEIARIGGGTPAQRKAWLERMRAIFPDVKAGSRLTGVFAPGAPTRFYLDGAPIGSVDDAAFGPAFAAIWLGPQTSAPGLRTALLGPARTP